MKFGRLLVRVDASSEIGLGHFVRCFALSQMMKDYFEIIFISKKIPKQSIDELVICGFQLTLIDHEESFFKMINSDDLIVLDGYGFDLEYQKIIKAKNAFLICIDDIHNIEFVADLIINHSPGVKPSDYIASDKTKFALGLEFALLRPSFLEAAKRTKRINSIQKLFICFGGSDIKNLTIDVLKIAMTFVEFKQIVVVSGTSNLNVKAIEKLSSQDRLNRIKHYNAVAETEILNLMIEADLVIVPSSGILLEAIASKSQIISGFYVENQINLFTKLKEFGAFESAEDFSSSYIFNAINKVLTSDLKNQNLINGKSGQNVFSIILESICNFREAEARDAKIIFEWANNMDVRSNAINKDKIEWESHLKWYNWRINSETCKILILELNKVPIGQIRYEKNENGNWVIDYSIAPEYRNHGFGTIIIKNSLNYFKSQKVLAQVKKNNFSSIAIFEKLQFKKNDTEIINNVEYLNFQYLYE